MKPNSYLILHLVNPSKFSAKKYLRNKGLLTTLYNTIMPETSQEERVTQLSSDFEDCKYQEKYDFSNSSSDVIFTQIFTDNITKNIRQNEQKLKIETIDEILDIAKRCGFLVHGKTSMKSCNGDDNQFLYILERTM
jgi:hypothetical protein